MKKPAIEFEPEAPFFDEQGGFHFHPVSSDARFAIELKPFPDELIAWFEQFQVSCVLSCCGIGALGFEPATRWKQQWHYDSRIMKLLQTLRDEIASAPSEVLSVRDFLQTFYKDDLLFLIDYLQNEMRKAIAWS